MNVESVAPAAVPADAHLIDVREQNEWDAGHAGTAQHLPASSLMENLEQLPETEEPLYIVCRSGGRSFQVTQWLNAYGIEAINVAGGMDQWFESGLPIVADGEGDAFIL